METVVMGRVLVNATVENIEDLWEVKRGLRSSDAARRATINDALVDTGARFLCLPTRYIRELGLVKRAEKPVITSKGPSTTSFYDPVRLSIQGRDCMVEVAEVPDTVPPLIGQIPLESMDFVVDPGNQRLIGDPAHGGEQVIEMF